MLLRVMLCEEVTISEVCGLQGTPSGSCADDVWGASTRALANIQRHEHDHL